MSRNEKILITGASGFVGHHLVKKLVNTNSNIILLNRNINKELEKIVKSDKCEFISCDLTKKDKLNEIDFTGVSSLIHLAAVMPESLNPFDDCIQAINNNFIGTVNLMNHLKNISFISYLSTIDVYGNPLRLPLKETDPTNPLSNYAISKLASEKFLQKFSHEKNIPLTVVRASHIYGPGEKKRKVIPIFIDSAISNEPIYLFGNGSDIRDYVYIDDVTDSILLSLNKKSSGIYNIGSGKGSTINEVASKIIELTESKSKIIYKGRNKEKINLVCDISHAKNDLSYNPHFSLGEGLKQEIEWFKKINKNSTNYFR